LQEAGKNLTAADGETVLDFSSVRRIDATALRALEEFARVADEKAVKVVLARRQRRRLQGAQAGEVDATIFFFELRHTLAGRLRSERENWHAEP